MEGLRLRIISIKSRGKGCAVFYFSFPELKILLWGKKEKEGVLCMFAILGYL